jgi:hypothetical protein
VCVLAVPPTPAFAQTSPISDANLVADGCGVAVRRVGTLAPAARYTVELIRAPEGPRLAVVVRVDDRLGHWLYPPTDAEQIAIDVPPTARPPINVTASAVRTSTGDDTPCQLSVAEPAPATDVPVAIASAAVMPSAHVDDTSALCEVPFERARAVGAPSIHLPAELRGTGGTAQVAIHVLPDGSVDRARVLESSSTVFGDAIAENALKFMVKPSVFRCMPIESTLFFRFNVRSTARPRSP